MLVPAGPRLSGSLDKAFGHFRRYTKQSLQEVLTEAGFAINLVRYMNLPGIITWYIAGKILRKRTLTRTNIVLYDRWIVPVVARLESVLPPPRGQSLLAIATVAR